MRADNTHYLLAAARRRAHDARARADHVLARLKAEKCPTSVSGLARAAGVSRSWLYEQPDLLDQLQRHNQTARTSTPGPATRASDASLTRRLELAHQRIRQLTEQNQRLRDQLERTLGALRAADPCRDPGPDHQRSNNNRDREDSTGHHRTGP